MTKQFSTSSNLSKEYNMASNQSDAHNNEDFKLSSVFGGVQDKVALITGNCLEVLLVKLGKD